MNIKLKREINKKTSEFLDNSTIHGVRYLRMKTHWFKKILWLTLILGSVTLCIVLSKRIWVTYVENPTVTVVQTTHYPTAKVPFPAVIICDSNMIYLPRTKNITNILTKRGYNETIINIFYESLSNFDSRRPKYDTISKMHSILQDIDISITSLLKLFSKPCTALLIECFWRSVPYNCTDMFRAVLNHNGYCCRFDIDYFSSHSNPDTNLEAGFLKSEALRFIVNRELDRLSNGEMHDRDIDIYIIAPNRPMAVIDNPIVLTSKTRLEFAIDAWVIDTSDDVKKLTKEARKCILPQDSHYRSSYFKGCISKGFHREVLNECLCLPFYYKNELGRNLPNCTWEQHACVYKASNKLKGNIAELANKYKCYPDCEHTQYDTQVDYVRHTISSNYSYSNNTDVIIRFFGNTCVKYRRELLFTWDQLLASLGGLFGLCTGGSILSIIELFYYFFDILLSVMISRFKIRNLEKRVRVQPAEERMGEKSQFKINDKIFMLKPKYSYID